MSGTSASSSSCPTLCASTCADYPTSTSTTGDATGVVKSDESECHDNEVTVSTAVRSK